MWGEGVTGVWTLEQYINFLTFLLTAIYLELGMRYEAGICTIVISMKRTFN